jgi:hypothetical protein
LRACRREEDDVVRDELAFQVEVVEPGESVGDLWLLGSPMRTSRSTQVDDQVDSSVHFTDAQGQRWERRGRVQRRIMR